LWTPYRFKSRWQRVWEELAMTAPVRRRRPGPRRALTEDEILDAAAETAVWI
jgi:hypothetical protein